MAQELDNKSPLGKLIFRELYKKGKNQKWLADRLGIDRSYVSVLCNTKKNIKANMILNLSNALGVTTDEILNSIKEG